MEKIKKGEWVQIHQVVLTPDQRAQVVPGDTKKVPLELWVKGVLEKEANLGDTVKVKTVTGRIAEGELVQHNPKYTHDFGEFVPELLKIDYQLKSIMYGGNDE